jgi:hypothetical protein
MRKIIAPIIVCAVLTCSAPLRAHDTAAQLTRNLVVYGIVTTLAAYYAYYPEKAVHNPYVQYFIQVGGSGIAILQSVKAIECAVQLIGKL